MRLNDTTFRSRPHWSRDDGEELTSAEVALITRGKRVLGFVPGYRAENGKERDAGDAFAHNVEELGYDVCVVIVWPNGRLRSTYVITQTRADDAGKRLALDVMPILSQAASVTMVAHSLGCAVALAAAAVAVPMQRNWKRTLLCGAAVPCNRPIPASFEVYYSRRDSVLKWAYPLGSLFVLSFQPALGLVGCRPLRGAIQFDLTESVPDHSGYWHSQPWRELARCQ